MRTLPYRPGGRAPGADYYNEMVDLVRRASTTASPNSTDGDNGLIELATVPWMDQGPLPPFMGKITGKIVVENSESEDVNLYTWTKQLQMDDGYYIDDPNGIMDTIVDLAVGAPSVSYYAIEDNNNPDVPIDGSVIVELRPSWYSTRLHFAYASAGDALEVGYQNSTTTIGGGLWSFSLVAPGYTGGTAFVTPTGVLMDVLDLNSSRSATTKNKYGDIIPTGLLNTTTGHEIGVIAELPPGSGANWISVPGGIPIPPSPATVSEAVSTIQVNPTSGLYLSTATAGVASISNMAASSTGSDGTVLTAQVGVVIPQYQEITGTKVIKDMVNSSLTMSASSVTIDVPQSQSIMGSLDIEFLNLVNNREVTVGEFSGPIYGDVPLDGIAWDAGAGFMWLTVEYSGDVNPSLTNGSFVSGVGFLPGGPTLLLAGCYGLGIPGGGGNLYGQTCEVITQLVDGTSLITYFNSGIVVGQQFGFNGGTDPNKLSARFQAAIGGT